MQKSDHRHGRLLRPRFETHTALLWLTPLVILVGGAIALLVLARRRSRPDESPKLSDEEEARVASLTGQEPSGRP